MWFAALLTVRCNGALMIRTKTSSSTKEYGQKRVSPEENTRQNKAKQTRKSNKSKFYLEVRENTKDKMIVKANWSFV